MALKAPTILEIDQDIYQINEFGLDCMYVVCGTERALVIDTGMGYCNFKEIIEELTDLPYDVVITHGHVDHAGGADLFEHVYMHPNDVQRAHTIPYDRRVKDGDTFRVPGTIWDYGPENVRYWDQFPGVLELYEGQKFDLGDREITVIYTPGHTYGSCTFLDPKSRIAFIGDALGGVPKSYVSKLYRGLLNLKKHEDEFDRMYANHASRLLNSHSIPKQELYDAIENAKAILEGRARCIPVTKENHFEATESYRTAFYGRNQLMYDSDRVQETDEWDPNYKNYDV